MKYYFVSIILFICLFSIMPNTGHSQIGNSQDEININLVPENPGANKTVYASIESYSIDLNSSKITWFVNGKEVKQTTGGKDLSFTTGDANSTTKLKIQIVSSLGQTIEKTLSINPASVDLIWQSDSSVPPFYKGKALFSHQNKITFVAVPHITYSGKEISPANLVYTWKRNGSVVEDASGYGKSTYSFTGSLISRTLNIEVTVTSPLTDSTAYGNSIVSPIEPSIILYEKNPLYGLKLQSALTNIQTLTEPEISIVAVPLFFGSQTYTDPGLVYKWSINGTRTTDESSQNTETLRPATGESGSSKISVSIENTKKILQQATTGFTIMFGNQNAQ